MADSHVGNQLALNRVNPQELLDLRLQNRIFLDAEEYKSFANLMSQEDALRYNQWMELRNAGLDQIKANDIILTNKGLRPNPNTYLNQNYINAHLAQFDDGASIVMTKEQYITYVNEKMNIGIPSDGTQFVIPKNLCYKIALKTDGDISAYEKALGFDLGHFDDGGGLVRIDIDNLKGLNLRLPSGNEAGANSHWIPGGKTDGGVSETITDLIPNKPNNITVIELK